MKEYLDNDLQEVNELSKKWQTEYENSNQFVKLTDDQRRQAFFITSTFAEMMYNYHYQKPTEWTTQALEDVICDLFPRKISSNDDFYAAVKPVLTAYFEFLIEKKYIDNGVALTKKLAKAAPLMRESASDSTSWSFAKQLVMSAKKQGVDFEDEDEFNRYIQSYNESLISQQPVVKSKVGRNTLCPCGSGKKYKKCCGNF